MVIAESAAFVMDPWGGSVFEAGVKAESDASALGFEDDFTDAVNSVDENHKARSISSTDATNVPFSSPSPSSINFIPRTQNCADESRIGSALNASSSSASSASSLPSLAPLNDPLTRMMTSEEYISRLETKLNRIKGGGGGGEGERRGRKTLSSSAKLMLDAFTIAKDSTAVHPIDGCDAPSDSSRMELNPNILLQRAFPERTPLTQEELEWLVNHDQLQAPEDEEHRQPTP